MFFALLDLHVLHTHNGINRSHSNSRHYRHHHQIQEPDFMDGPIVLLVVISATTVIRLSALPFVFDQIYAQAYVGKELRIEDYLSYLACCACIVYTAADPRAISIGMALHRRDVSLATLVDAIYTCDVVSVCRMTTSGLAKTVASMELKKIFAMRLRAVDSGSLLEAWSSMR